MSIRENYLEILKRKNEAAKRVGRKAEDVLLLAVTKKHVPSELQEALDAGATDFGENKVQELLSKYDEIYPERWHLIGHLQTNKVKQVIDKVTMIHSVDSIKLAKEIDKRAAAADLVMDILIEINLAEEESKTGIAKAEVFELVASIVNTCVFRQGETLLRILVNISERRDQFTISYGIPSCRQRALPSTRCRWECPQTLRLQLKRVLRL